MSGAATANYLSSGAAHSQVSRNNATVRESVPTLARDAEVAHQGTINASGAEGLYGDFSHGEFDDDDEKDDAVLEAASSTKGRWISAVFGVGQRGWSHVRKELAVALGALFLVVIAAILHSTCQERCDFIGAHISSWFYLLAYMVAISIPGRLMDKLFFAGFSTVSEVITFSFMNPIFFYVGAFEGAIARFFWIGISWSNWDSILTTTKPNLVEDAARALFVFQVLAVLRNLAFRISLRHVLIGSFENSINDVLFQNLVLVGLSRPHAIDAGGHVIKMKDPAYKELLRMFLLTDFRRKLDFISKLRFRMYNKEGLLVPISRKDIIAAFAKYAFKNVARIPRSALVEFATKSDEYITDAIQGAAGQQEVPSADPSAPPTVNAASREMPSVSLLNAPLAVMQPFQRAGQPHGLVFRHNIESIADADTPDFFIGQGDSSDINTSSSIRHQRSTAGSTLPPQLQSLKAKASGALASIADSARSYTGGVSKAPRKPYGISESAEQSQPNTEGARIQTAAPVSRSSSHRSSRALTAHTFVDPVSILSRDPFQHTGAVHKESTIADAPHGALSPSIVTSESLRMSELPSSARSRPASAPRGRAQSAFFDSNDVHKVLQQQPSQSRGEPAPVAPGAMKHAKVARRPSSDGVAAKVSHDDVVKGLDLLASKLRTTRNSLPSSVRTGAGLVPDHTIASIGQQMGRFFADAIRSGLHPDHTDSTRTRDDSNDILERKKPKIQPKLGLSHFAACLDADDVDIEKALLLFDSNGDNLVERSEFLSAVENFWTNLRSLKASLDGQQSVTTAINWLLDVIFWLLFMCAALWIYDVPVVQVFVPLGTVLVSMSFAIGHSLSNVVSSLIFVLVTKPYNVGDRVTCSGVFNGEETLIVRRIDVLTSTFIRMVNKEIIVPNHMLLQQNIENFKRSPPAAIKVELKVSYLTTASQLERLRRRLNAFLESQPLAWKPTSVIRMATMHEQSLMLSVWLQSFFLWQDAPRLYRAIFAMYMHLLAIMREEGIAFRAPDQTLKIDGVVNAKMAFTSKADAANFAYMHNSESMPSFAS